MIWVELVIVLALLQFFVFSLQVSFARGRHNLPAPAMSGNPIVERYLRVHYNTLELLILFLPSIWIAAKYSWPYWMAGLGAVYLLGRRIYSRAYVKEPKSRTFGFALSAFPILAFMIIALIGVLRAMLMT